MNRPHRADECGYGEEVIVCTSSGETAVESVGSETSLPSAIVSTESTGLEADEQAAICHQSRKARGDGHRLGKAK